MDDHRTHDVIGTLHAMPQIWQRLLAAVGDATPSPLPGMAAALTALGDDAPEPATPDAFLQRLRDRTPHVAARVRDLDPAAADGLMDAVTHAFRSAARALDGVAAPTRPGVVVRVNASDGGVPKRSVRRAAVGARGIDGDRQAERRHHGKPLQALSLYSQEVIDALREEGHPIAAGAAGENVTVAGLDWPALRPGVKLRIGTVLAETSAPATPCVKNARWFHDGDFRRIDHDLHPGRSRWYAWVLEPGEIAEGDAVQPV